jgi:hypothetical protein
MVVHGKPPRLPARAPGTQTEEWSAGLHPGGNGCLRGAGSETGSKFLVPSDEGHELVLGRLRCYAALVAQCGPRGKPALRPGTGRARAPESALG